MPFQPLTQSFDMNPIAFDRRNATSPTPPLTELVERARGEAGDAAPAAGSADTARMLAGYHDSSNGVERFLSHHASAALSLRASHRHLLRALEAIEYADRKVLERYIGLCGFLGCEADGVGPSIAFGAGAVRRGDVPTGLSAVVEALSRDRSGGWGWACPTEHRERVADVYAAAADAVGWAPAGGIDWSNKQARLAVVVSNLQDTNPSARAAAAFAGAADAKRVRPAVYVTDPAACDSAVSRRLATLKIPVWTAPAADVVTQATALAEQLVADQTDVLLADVSHHDAGAGLVAHWTVARARIVLVRQGGGILARDTGIPTAAVYTDEILLASDAAAWAKQNLTPVAMTEGVDFGTEAAEPPARASLGIPDAAVILSTVTHDARRFASSELPDAVAGILKQNPQAVYLLVEAAGGTEVVGATGELRRRFDAAGVGKRVGIVARPDDAEAFARVADIYLAEVDDDGSARQVLSMMAAGVPAVAREGIEYAGSEACADAAGYADRAGRLIRDAAYRQQQGRSAKRRVQQHFGYDQTARHIEAAVDALLGRRDASDDGVSLEDPAARDAA